MDNEEANRLVRASLPKLKELGLCPLQASSVIKNIEFQPIASLWKGMGHVYRITFKGTTGGVYTIVAKRVELPEQCDSFGDQRKKDSYNVEAAFYSQGHASRLYAFGAACPRLLHVEKTAIGADGDLTICMTEVKGCQIVPGCEKAFVCWLAKLHALYWGSNQADAAVASGLQKQGCYWHLDTRPEEHARMGTQGWIGRLKLAARAIDLRLKADPMQSICHGDAKGANVIYAKGGDGILVPLVYDFQYCGKACVAKDLAYFFNVQVHDSKQDTLLRLYHKELSARLRQQFISSSKHGSNESRNSIPKENNTKNIQMVCNTGESENADDSSRSPFLPTLKMLQTSLELALADWRRFSEIGLCGWGDNSANHRVIAVLDALDGGKVLASEQAYIDAMNREFPINELIDR